MRILIVEDEIKIRTGLGKLIEAVTSHQVIGEAKNGVEGLEQIRAFHPDVVITDIRMPDMDGLQMVKAMREAGMNSKVVILTGFAQFEYAQTAIGLGVADYLLKPLGPEDVIRVLEKIDSQIKRENEEKTDEAAMLSAIYLSGNTSDVSSQIRALERFCRDKAGDSDSEKNSETFAVLAGFMDNTSAQIKEQTIEAFNELTERFALGGCISIIDRNRELVGLLFGERDNTERFVSRLLARLKDIRRTNRMQYGGLVFFDDPDDMPGKISEASNLLNLALVSPREGILTRELSEKMQLLQSPYSYPKSCEGELKNDICSGAGEHIEKDITGFMNYMRTGNFAPEHVKQGYMRYLNYIATILQEIDEKSYLNFQNEFFIRQQENARTLEDLEDNLKRVGLFLAQSREKKEDIRNYTIKRAINYIRENYVEGVTLEETADTIGITPEYLSTLFVKEMGINFSTFVKEFKISHAKRLLKGTDMKIYEVAEAVGFRDSKYFVKVFKEVQGVSPKEYRNE